VAENWESEFLQMAAFVLLTVFLFQKGSPESNDPDERSNTPDSHGASDAPWPARRGRIARWLYSHSLSILFIVLFLFSFGLHLVAGQKCLDDERRIAGQPPAGMRDYLASGRFWFESMQNWQSEFLSLAAMVYASVYLRERGSAESKSISSPHEAHE
jgi:hypothetical protein